jgi:cell division protein FtsQ
MWDDPNALTLLSRLIVATTLAFTFWVVGRQAAEAWLPIRHVEVSGATHDDTRLGLRTVVAKLAGGLFSVDLTVARREIEGLPWVHTATVRRVWPDTLAVTIEEHVPSAAWNDLAVMDVNGEVFPVRPWKGLPSVHAPEGMEREVARRYGQFAALLAPGGWRIDRLRVDARQAWELGLADGTVLELGRERMDERLKRFAVFYPMVAERMRNVRRIDMRYPNGFAVQGSAIVQKKT